MGLGRSLCWNPMHEQPVFNKMGLFVSECYKVAERLARRGFYIQSGLALTEVKIEKVTITLEEVFEA